MPDSAKSIKPSLVIAATALLFGLYMSAGYSYLLFHSLMEFTTITIAFTLHILNRHMLNELACNTLKVVFKARGEGEVNVSLKQDGEGRAPRL